VELVLSLFPGVDLLGRAFEEEGYCVVRGPDLITGGDIKQFHAPAGRFEGIIAGSPCQDFSSARRSPPTGEGVRLLREFCRVVAEARPMWFLLENVPGVPDVEIDGYSVQRIAVTAAAVGLPSLRLRHVQFGSLAGEILPHRWRDGQTRTTGPREPTALASDRGRTDWARFCARQGLSDFDLPGFTRSAKYRAVGNGVPLPLGRYLARLVRGRIVHQGALCACGCGAPVQGKARFASARCRQRAKRDRDRTRPENVRIVTL
jgi:DNA (cytosine-5)-methyltransferase 1